MPYNTEYDRMIAHKLDIIRNRYLNHIDEQHITPATTLDFPQHNVGGAIEKEEYTEVILKPKPERKKREKTAKPKIKKSGKGLLSGIVGMLGLGKEEVKEGGAVNMSPQDKLNKIIQEGGSMIAQEQVKRSIGGKKRGRKPKAQTNKDKEDEKMSMEIKGLKDNETKKGSGIISGIIGALGLGKEGEGAKEYKKKGGRKLLTKAEMPPSQMSGNGKKANPWMSHLAAFRKEHPEFKGKKLMEEAKKSYKK